jgi:hypothetical protein
LAGQLGRFAPVSFGRARFSTSLQKRQPGEWRRDFVRQKPRAPPAKGRFCRHIITTVARTRVAASNGSFSMSHDAKLGRRVREQASSRVLDLNGFDYNAPAELFPSRSRAGRSRSRYMRFDTAAEGLRFVIEELPAPAALGAYLVIEETRFGLDEMRDLYENAGYPLTRSMAASC